MTPELITAVMAGLVGLVGAGSAFSANRSKQNAADHKVLKGRVRSLEKQNLDMIAHIFQLEKAIIKCGCEAPNRPKSLEEPLPEDVL